MEDAPEGYNIVKGTIKHMVYLGSETSFDVALDNGRNLKVLRSNLTRWEQEDFTVGETVWLAFNACSPARAFVVNDATAYD